MSWSHLLYRPQDQKKVTATLIDRKDAMAQAKHAETCLATKSPVDYSTFCAIATTICIGVCCSPFCCCSSRPFLQESKKKTDTGNIDCSVKIFTLTLTRCSQTFLPYHLVTSFYGAPPIIENQKLGAWFWCTTEIFHLILYRWSM